MSQVRFNPNNFAGGDRSMRIVFIKDRRSHGSILVAVVVGATAF
jgi:hypothetical protein